MKTNSKALLVILIGTFTFLGCSKSDKGDVVSTQQKKNEINNPVLSAQPIKVHSQSLLSYNETEPNDTRATANGMVYSTKMNGKINSSGDVDWFMVNLAQFGGNFYLTGSSYYISGTVYDENGAVLGYISYQTNYTILYQGKVYIAISGYPNTNYSLTLTGDEETETEPNNTFAQANGPISHLFQGIADGTTVGDYVKFILPRGASILFQFTVGQYVTAYIYNSKYQYMGTISGNGDLTVLNLLADTYYAEIIGYQGTNYAYTMHYVAPY